jgi:uncharacterized damage-inducible protein DinB
MSPKEHLHVTRKLSPQFLLLAAFAATASAQGPASTSAQTATANPISSSHSKMYSMLSGVVVAAAEKMPEENYSYKPTPEVRSFGQLVGHLADSQFYFCSQAAGESKSSGGVEKNKTSKADLVASLKDAVAYCKSVYADMTDTKGAEMVKMMNTDFARLGVLAANVAHDYEHYGNMVTYMRLKNIVPPTSEKKAAAGEK